MRAGNGASGPDLAEIVPHMSIEPARVGARWGDLRARVLSAAVLVTVAVVCLQWGGWPWAGLVLLAAGGLGLEWGNLSLGRLTAPGGMALAGGLISGGLAFVLGYPPVALVLAVGGAALGGAIAGCAWRGAFLASGVLVLSPGIIGLLWLRDDPVAGFGNILFVLLVVWSSDIGAYMTGRAFGGPKLAPAISPGKTISGALGGLAAASLMGILAAAGLTVWAGAGAASGVLGRAALLGALLGAVLGVVAQIGDLAESWLKRHAGVKDSSQLIPGHGGLLDRLDALLVVVPVAGCLAWFLGRGVVLWG